LITFSTKGFRNDRRPTHIQSGTADQSRVTQRVETVDIDAVAQRALRRCWHRASILLGPDFTVTWASPSVDLVVGYQPEDLVGMSALDLLHPDDLQVAADILLFEAQVDPSIRLGMRQRSVREIRVRNSDGGYSPLEFCQTNFLDDPEIAMILIDVASPTQFRHVDRAMELTRIGGDLSEILTLALVQFSNGDPMQPAGAVFDDHGKLLAATANAPAPYGPVSPDTYRNTWDTELIDSGSSAPVGVARFWCHYEVSHPFDIESSTRVARHAAVALGHHRSTQELQRAALNDPLTGIANRRALQQDLQARLDRNDEVLLAYLDLDGFKAINDAHGHAAGDHVLKVVAGRLSEALRSGDIAARMGGDEFVLLLGPPAPPADIIRDRLALAIGAPIPFGEELLHISASVGFGANERDAEALLRIADRAMLQTKHRR
jgi:diguanylate cyclase (GGDEF)-like protein